MNDSEMDKINEGNSQTVHSIPQTAMISDNNNQDDDVVLSGDVTENSVGNLFNNAKLNKPKLPPLQVNSALGVRNDSRGKQRRIGMANDMAAANQTMTINQSRKKGDFESIINSEHLVPPQTASINQRKNIVLNV